VTSLRGRVLEETPFGIPAVVTVHPSAILRAGERRDERRRGLLADLVVVRETLVEGAKGAIGHA
jgi:hypothetical protein